MKRHFISFLIVLCVGLVLSAPAQALQWVKQTVDSVGDVGQSTSLALDSSGRPRITYCDYTNGNLRYAYWNGAAWAAQTVDSVGNVGMHTSLALDNSGEPHVSYYDYGNGDLKYAYWNGSSWDIDQVDYAGQAGGFTSLAFDANGLPRISYYDYQNLDLKYAYAIPEPSCLAVLLCGIGGLVWRRKRG